MIEGAGQGPLLSFASAELRLSDGQRRSIVRVADCHLHGGHCYSLVGPSGVGKTTALEMLSLVKRPTVITGATLATEAGPVDLKPLIESDQDQRLDRLRAANFGYIIQASLLLPFLTVRENIEVSQRLVGRPDAEYIDELVELLELGALQRAYPGALSGGQRQRACVARALAHKPSLVMADEPTSAVDAEMGRLVIGILQSYAVEAGAAVLVVTHNVALAEAFELEQLALTSNVSDGTMLTVIGSPAAVSAEATAMETLS